MGLLYVILEGYYIIQRQTLQIPLPWDLTTGDFPQNGALITEKKKAKYWIAVHDYLCIYCLRDKLCNLCDK